MIDVDLWSTGYRGYLVHLPLSIAVKGESLIRQRLVFCQQSVGAVQMQELGLESCGCTGAGSLRQAVRLIPQVLRTRRELNKFYRDSGRNRIVHVAMASPWDQLYLDIPKRHGAKILLVIHDAVRHLGEESWIMDRLESRLYGMADEIAVLTPYAGKVLRERLGNNKPIHVVSPGLVMNASPPGPAKIFRQDRPLRFLFFGRIHAYKGLDLLIEAWKLFRSNTNAPKAELSIVGSGDVTPYLDGLTQLKDASLEHGWLTDARMAEIFETHDVNVLPYREGSESATALAGMWAGMPTIATKLGCFAEKLFHNKNALLVDGNPVSIASALTELSSCETLFTRLAQGTKSIAESWSAPNVARKWGEVYESISKKHRFDSR